MQFLFDNLIATMVAMALTISLMGQQVRNRQEGLERISVYSAKTQSLGFAEWLEDDVVKLGARFGRSRERFETTTVTRGGIEFTDRFEYYYNEGRAENNQVRRVEVLYELVPDTQTRAVIQKGPTAADDVTLDLYRLVRSTRAGQYDLGTPATSPGWVGGEPPWDVTAEYQSPPGLRHFLIEPRDSDQQPVGDGEPEKADYVRVQFSVVPTLFPLHRARLVPQRGLHWATTVEIRPF